MKYLNVGRVKFWVKSIDYYESNDPLKTSFFDKCLTKAALIWFIIDIQIYIHKKGQLQFEMKNTPIIMRVIAPFSYFFLYNS